ncbi:MAG: DNA cytosine methyltransferase [Vampirovibrionia bacterium]
MRILNLYACLGGNRYKWGDEHEITAVEWDEELAKLYQERFPNDTVVVADAHQYLLDHYKEFDFIWSSPPCPTHSRMNYTFKNRDNFKLKYPDMRLYQEVIFLDNFFNGRYVVENVIPYYDLLIPAKKRERHLYWTNFNLPNNLSKRTPPQMNCNKNITKKVYEQFMEFHDVSSLIKKYKGKQDKGKIARNLVDYEAGKTILDTVMGIIKKKDIKQTELF